MRILEVEYCPYAEVWRSMGLEVRRVLPLGRAGLNTALGDQGWDLYADLGQTRQRLAAIVDDFAPDLIVLGDSSAPSVFFGLERFGIPVVWSAVDAHVHFWYPLLAGAVDMVWAAQSRCVADLGQAGVPVVALPLSARRLGGFVPWGLRQGGLSFVGKVDPAVHPERVALFRRLQSSGLDLRVVQGDYMPVYQQSHGVVNQCIHDDLNYRFFEAAACGAVVLQPELSHSMHEVLEPGRDFLLWRDDAELMAQSRWLLANPGDAEAMARRAWTKIAQAHTVQARASQALALLPQGRSPFSIPARSMWAALAMAVVASLGGYLPAFRQQLAAVAEFEALRAHAEPLAPLVLLIVARLRGDEAQARHWLESLRAAPPFVQNLARSLHAFSGY